MKFGILSRPLPQTLAISLLLAAGSANAGLFRTYVSQNGSDANPCTLSQPCRLLPAALAAANDGGEIWILDSANFNTAPFVIDRNITILAIPGVVGSIVAIGGDAIDINTAGVKVALRNLSILNLSAGVVHGINMTNGSKLVVDGCVIYGFTLGSGIIISTAAVVDVVDTMVRNNHDGIMLDKGATTTISRTNVLNNSFNGVASSPTAPGTVTTHINDSVLSGNQYGAVAQGFLGASRMYITRTVASSNTFDGFQTSNGGQSSDTIIVLSGSIASSNGRWGITNFAGTINTDGTNVSAGNTSGNSNGAITVVPTY